MKNAIKSILFFLFISFNIITAQKFTLKGIVFDSHGKSIPLANVMLKELKLLNITDKRGEFEIKNIPAGEYTLIVSRLGFKTFEKRIEIRKSGKPLLIRLSASPVLLGQAIVTGLRVEGIEKNIAFPIESVNEKELEVQVPNSVADVLETKPGVNVARDGVWGTMLNVRGLSKQNLVYLVDGARIETSTNIAGGLSLFDLNDVEKIEVVKGGISSLYGTGATGGIVNIVTRKANFAKKFYTHGLFNYAYKSVNRASVLGFNFYSGSKTWKAKISLGSRNAGDAKIPGGYLKNSGFKDYSYSFSGGLLVANNLELNAEFQFYQAKNVGIPGGAAFPENALASYPLAKRELFSLKAIWRNPFAMVSTASLQFYNQFIRRDVEIVPAPGKKVSPSSDHSTKGITLQLESVAGKNYFTSGFDLWARTYKGTRVTENENAGVKIIDKPIPDSEFGSLGFFLKDEIHFSERFKIGVGGRYDFIRITNKETSNPVSKFVNGQEVNVRKIPDASFEAGKYFNRSWSGNLNFLIKPKGLPDFTFSVAHSFRSPSLEERFQYINLGGIVYLGNPQLLPERNISFDAGIRIFKNNFSAKANLFVSYFNNLVIDQVVVKDSLYKKENVGKSRFYGVEGEMQAKVCQSVWRVTLAYVNAYDTELNSPLPNVPPLNGSVEFSAPVSKILKLTFYARFYSDLTDVPKDETKKPGFAVYNLYLSSADFNLFFVKVKFVSGVENIFNRKYENPLSTYRGISVAEPGRNIFAKILFEW